MKLILIFMAWRNIWRNRTRSLIIMSSVAIGILAGISVLALYQGMINGRIKTLIENETGHIQLHHPFFKNDFDPSFLLPSASLIVKSLKDHPMIRSFTFRTVTSGMLSTSTGSAGVEIIGIDPVTEKAVSSIDDKVIEGILFTSSDNTSIVVGKKLADKMQLFKGAKIVLTFSDASGNIVSAAFRISGIYQSDNSKRDELIVYIPRNELGSLLSTPDFFHEVSILVKQENMVGSVLSDLRNRFPDLMIESWKEISPETDLLIQTVDQYSYIIMVIIMCALSFGIINTMLMAILERTREIGMMMALGTTQKQVFWLILMETVMLTLLGTPFGIMAGWLVSNYYHVHGLDLSSMGRELMSSFGFHTVIYPTFPRAKLSGIILIVVTTAVISSLLPALRALRLKVVEAMNY